MEQAQRHIGVDVAGRLVGHQHVGTGNDGTCDGDTLLLSARQRSGTRRRPVRQTHPGEHFFDRRSDFALVGPRQAQGQRNIVEGR